jgi:uncharacterized repeat protein (TIGR01451 family)
MLRRGRAGLLGRALLAAVLMTAPVVVGLLAPAAPAGAYVDQGAGFSDLSCFTSDTANTSGWGWAQAPAGTVRARFTIVGGGGAAGDNYDGTGGAGGPGNTVSGTVAINPGQRLWARIGCGGTDANSNQDWGGRRAAGWARGGPAEDFGGGGGGGATGLCIGSGTGGCGGGAMVAIAGGGGGGGRGSGTGTCNPAHGGGGGYNTFDPNIGSNGGIGRNAGGGIAGTNNGSVGGGGGGNGVGGGGGYSGGGGGGGGADPVCAWPVSGTPRGGAGGGAGSSWVRNDVWGYGWGHANAWTNGCGNGLGVSVGHAAPAGTGARGCHGFVWVTWEVNQAPTGQASTTANANKGTPLTISLTNNDPDGDGRTCIVTDGPDKGAWSQSGCSITYTASSGQPASNDKLTYRVQDTPANGAAALSSPTYDVTIPIVNRAPTGSAQALSATKGVGLPITLAAADLDGEAVTCSTSTPTKGSLTGSGCSRTYTANAGTSGSDSFTYTVNDGQGGSNTYTISLSIQNRAPGSANQTVEVAPGATTTVAFGGSDPDGDPTTCATSTPTGGVLEGGSGCSRTYTAPSALGSYSFTYTRSDAFGGTSPAATVTVDVRSPDVAITKSHVGVFDDGSQGTYEIEVSNVGNGPTSGTITVVDTLPTGMTHVGDDGATAGFSCTSSAGGTVVTCTRSAPLAASATAGFAITVAVAEGAASGTNTATVSATPDHGATNNTAVDPTTVNRRPTAGPVAVATTVDAPVAVTLAGADAEGGALTYAVGAASSGTVSGTAPNLIFTPVAGSVDDVTFTYTVADPHGHTSFAATVTITVTRPGVHGVVTEDGSGDPLEGITVRLYRDGVGFTAHTDTTDATGWYDVGPVPDGAYRVIFRDPSQDHVDEWYDDSLLRSASDTVTVTAGAEIAADAGLAPGAQIDVAITNPGLYTVGLYNSGPVGASAYRSVSGVTGSTSLRGLPAGSYYVSVTDPSGALLAKWSGNETVRGQAEAVALTAGASASRSFTLPSPNTIEGTITDGVGPVPGVTVQAYDAVTAAFVRSTKTDEDGVYAMRGVAAGAYKLVFRDTTGAHPVTWYGGEVIGSADIVTMTPGAVVTVDDEIPRSASLSGTVTGGADGTTPLVGAKVTLYRNGIPVKTYVADGSGTYTAVGLAPGDYTALFTATGHRTEYNLDRSRRADADVIVVGPGAQVDVDATLAQS